MTSFCSGWEFTPQWAPEFLRGEGAAQPVRLPHTVKELPLHYSLNEDYELVSGYRRRLFVPAEWEGKRIFLQLDGAAHIATVFCNGTELASHGSGYTAFRTELTGALRYGEENLVAVRLDSTENGAVPPFGFVIDYLTYGGLYREAWLDVRPQNHIRDLFVAGDDKGEATVRVETADDGGELTVELLDSEGEPVASQSGSGREFSFRIPGAALWSPESPTLYTCRATLRCGEETDVSETRFGFRTCRFTAEGFFLNGKKIFLRGLNRHQCFPWIGYAAPERLQREDARILKEELHVNAVRTSHYPQSQHFIDECDRLGLLVFTEIPGWQHIGDDAWKDQACENVREMVRQYRNHPSIVLWGVRINESQDDDEFYTRTNRICHELDASRQTSGVRYLENSSLLEDVYAFNDFSHEGTAPGCKPKEKVTKASDKGFLISEHSGHMFPTKSFDPWEKRQEHALRHARVLNAAMADGKHAGCFGWCMFDYNTHKDFGSGDRICYHGVMDAFRNPKLAAALYASQSDDEPVLEVGSNLDIGDYPGGNIGTTWVFSNADEVKLYKNDKLVCSLPASPLTALPHGPRPVDDMIGQLLKTEEGFDGEQEELLHRCLLAAGKHGIANLPLGDKLRMGWVMLRYHMSYQDGVDLYGKYVGNWGGEATRWRFDALKDGKVVASLTRRPGSRLHLEVRATARALKDGIRDGGGWDAAAIRVRILDENGNVASYAQLPVRFAVSGRLELACPEVVTAEGGMCGAYVRTAGEAGEALLTVSAEGLEPVTIPFQISV